MFLFLNGNPEWANIIDISFETLIQIGFVWFNLIVIVFILSWLLYRPITNFLSERKKRIEKDIFDAKEAKKAAEEDKKVYSSKLSEINQERDKILDNARKMAISKEEEILENAKSEAELIIKRAEIEIERAQLAAKDEMRKQIVEVGSLIAERFISKSITPELEESLLNKAIEDLDGGDKGWI